jgi:hypothetical protein
MEHNLNTSAAPKQRSVFVINPIGREFMEDTWLRNTLIAILNGLVPAEADREQWDLAFDMVKRGDKKNSEAVE